MKKIQNIIESEVAPDKNQLWLDKGHLKYYGRNGWEDIKIQIPPILPEGGTEGQVLKKTENSVEWGEDNNTLYNKATKDTLGLVKAVPNIENLGGDVELSEVITKINTILAGLRTSGLLI
jgi:hypothetical protein